MTRVRWILSISLLLCITSCANKEEQLRAQKEIEEAAQEVCAVKDELGQAEKSLDSIRSIHFDTDSIREEALTDMEEIVNGAKSKLENADQRLQAAYQTYKDITGKDFQGIKSKVAGKVQTTVPKDDNDSPAEQSEGGETN